MIMIKIGIVAAAVVDVVVVFEEVVSVVHMVVNTNQECCRHCTAMGHDVKWR